MSYANRTTHGSTNHFLPAAGPAFVKAWIFDQDGQVVAASVMAALRARWASRDGNSGQSSAPSQRALECEIPTVPRLTEKKFQVI